MSTLITGGTGFLGAHLAKRLVKEGYDLVLFDITPNYKIVADISDRVKIVQGDLALWADVINTVKMYNIETIFHLGAVLSAAVEARPFASFGVNFIGTLNILEAARLFNVKKIIFASSIAVYGPDLPQPVVEDVRLEPRSLYGISKVFSELLGLYYWRRYGIDFRAVRFPSVVGPGRGPGGASAYTSLIIQRAALGVPYEIDVKEETRVPMLYVKDAVSVLSMLKDVNETKSRIYNIAGISPTAIEIVKEVKRHIPDANLKFSPKPEIVAIVNNWPTALCDEKAHIELGWNLMYPLDRLVMDFIEEMRTKRILYE
jgi:threonine 3-dehydrogenase